ncbi:hypothetical protein WKW80_22280 [Variovorax humicola]|uniref:Uncharacterized protein n=1 Tax=Variovorax humicola TaxID=1769758 RepID=A0ABU8W3U1_9BURK
MPITANRQRRNAKLSDARGNAAEGADVPTLRGSQQGRPAAACSSGFVRRATVRLLFASQDEEGIALGVARLEAAWCSMKRLDQILATEQIPAT